MKTREARWLFGHSFGSGRSVLREEQTRAFTGFAHRSLIRVRRHQLVIGLPIQNPSANVEVPLPIRSEGSLVSFDAITWSESATENKVSLSIGLSPFHDLHLEEIIRPVWKEFGQRSAKE